VCSRLKPAIGIECYAYLAIQLDVLSRLGVTCHFDSQTLGLNLRLGFCSYMQTPFLAGSRLLQA